MIEARVKSIRALAETVVGLCDGLLEDVEKATRDAQAACQHERRIQVMGEPGWRCTVCGYQETPAAQEGA